MPDAMVVERTLLETPVGPIGLFVAEGVLRAVTLRDHEDVAGLVRRFGPIELRDADGGAYADAFRRYFAGELAAIDTLSVDTGGTPFQQSVWKALRDVRCGTTVSYAELAVRVGSP